MALNINILEFGSMFAYTPRPESNNSDLKKEMDNTRTWTNYLKRDRMVRVTGIDKEIPMTRYVSEVIGERLPQLPFSDFFDEDTALIPVPSSSQVPKGDFGFRKD